MPNWDPIEDLAHRVLRQGEPLILTPEVMDVLRRSAREFAFADAEIEPALRTAAKARVLLRKVDHRNRSGSRRLSTAQLKMFKLRDARDLEGARKVMRDLLAVEVVPHRRGIIEAQLKALDRWKPTLWTDPPQWPAVRQLVSRIKARKPLRLTPEVVTTLKRAAPTLGFDAAETAKGLRTVESATALLRKMDRRIRRGAEQLLTAAIEMYLFRERGEIEEARKVMHDLLAVEVVPHRRRILYHYLAQLDRTTPSKATITRRRKARRITPMKRQRTARVS